MNKLIWMQMRLRRAYKRANELEALLEAELAKEWSEDDRPLPEDESIRAVHPTRTQHHDLYAEAMRLVGAKRSKRALVSLVNWLLYRYRYKPETEPEPSELKPRGEGTEGGWIRIGRIDDAHRRALWVRFTEHPEPITGAASEIATRAEIEPLTLPVVDAIELCAGREGDDAYVKITREHPLFVELEDIFTRAAGHIPERHL